MHTEEHRIVVEIANRYRVPLSDRSCTGNHMWDGRTLATRWNPTDYKAEEEWYQNNPCGLFNLEDFLLPSQPVEADLLLHEIGHHLAAPEYCRDLPEWGLMPVLGSLKYMANSGFHRLSRSEQEHYTNHHANGVVDKSEQADSEAFAFLFGLTMCHTHGVQLRTTSDFWLRLYSPGVKLRHESGYYQNRSHVVERVRAVLNPAEAEVMDRLIRI